MSGERGRTPVALLIFNRPQTTERVLAAIAQARPPRLLVIGDGPRHDRPDEAQLVRDTRALLERVDWPCEILTCYSEINLGCKRRIATGLDWVFSQTGEAIILEDDCVPHPSFFRFCEELLTRYRDDERVHMVSGCNTLGTTRFTSDSYYFSRWYHIWGWATWARAWEHYEIEMSEWPELRETDWLERQLHSDEQARVLRAIFDGAHSGYITTWDFQWVFQGWLREALCAKPGVNLVTNIGYGELATNERDAYHPLANLPAGALPFPLRHPREVSVLKQADDAEFALAHPNPSNLRPDRLRDRVRALFHSGPASIDRPS